MLRSSAVGVLIGFIAIQFFRPNPIVSSEITHDFMATYSPPKWVAVSLRNACYDCHSDETIRPWYGYVQPVGWLIDQHVEEGKAMLNFSSAGRYPRSKMVAKLDAIADVVEHEEMPPKSYAMLHPKAQLTKEQSKELSVWAEALRDELSSGKVP